MEPDMNWLLNLASGFGCLALSVFLSTMLRAEATERRAAGTLTPRVHPVLYILAKMPRLTRHVYYTTKFIQYFNVLC